MNIEDLLGNILSGEQFEEAQAEAEHGAMLVRDFIFQGRAELKFNDAFDQCMEVKVVEKLWKAHQWALSVLMNDALGLQGSILVTASSEYSRQLLQMAGTIATAYNLGVAAGKGEVTLDEWRSPELAAAVLLGAVRPEGPEEEDGSGT